MTLREYLIIGGAAALVLVGGIVGHHCGASSRASEIADLSTRLATSDHTVEIDKGLFARQAGELTDLKDLLSKLGEENVTLKKQLDDSQAQVLTLNELVIKWKKAYESAVSATQTQTEPGRDRVDFKGSVGPFTTHGYTLTNPPQAWVSIEQTRAIRLALAVTRNKNGTWSSIVSSDDPDLNVDVAVSAVDPTVTSPNWKQRIWLDGAFDALGDRRIGLGLSYHFDRVSFGISCSSWGLGVGCGVTAGYRLFK